MTQYEALESEYEDELCIEEKEGMKSPGLYSDGCIWIKKEIPTAARACVLAEEIGHYEMTVGNILNLNDENNARQERKARAWAYKKILPINRIAAGIMACNGVIYEMAEYLNVDEKFLRDCLKYYGLLDI